VRTVLALLGAFVMLSAAAAAGGYTVDRNRTDSIRQVLRDADRLAEQPPGDNPLPYFSLHNDLAAAAGVEPCSPFALRMTERFLPAGWEFDADDVAAIRAGEQVPRVRVHTGEAVPTGWQC
jgi:hypothetical protein